MWSLIEGIWGMLEGGWGGLGRPYRGLNVKVFKALKRFA